MLLVVTIRKDPTMERVTSLVNSRVLRLNIDENPLSDLTYEWDGKKFNYSFKGENLRDVTSVWYRLAYVMYLNENPGTYEMFNRLSREEMVSQLYGLLDNAFWVSKPYDVKKAENKTLQLEIAKEVGFCVPITMTTSSIKDAVDFRNRVHGNIVVKPLVKHLVKTNGKYNTFYTTRITENMDVDFSLLPMSPAIFQQEIERQYDIRCVVVKDQVFPLAIYQVRNKTGDVDYRTGSNKDLDFEPCSLPKSVETSCVDFVKYFNLQYSSIDLILGTDGNYYFLENNPCGAWVFVEIHGGYNISQSIANLLSV